MNKRILSVFVFSAALLSIQAQDRKGGISDAMLNQIKQSYEGTSADKALRNAIGNNDIRKLALNQENLTGMDTHFSVKVNSKGITDQKSSGRCWLFTGLNVMRAKAIGKYGFQSFEFSEIYPFFWDQLEKANLFLQGIIDTRALDKEKTAMLGTIYRMLVLNLGVPPTEFDYVRKDAQGNPAETERHTPMSFLKKYGDENLLTNYVMVMNDPSREYYKCYEIDYDRHRYDGKNWTYVNLPVEDIKEMAIASLKDSTMMYFSCDVGKFLNSERGLLDVKNYDYESLMGTTFNMDKKQRIQTFSSGSSHAMTLMAVELNKDGKPVKWMVENSWGPASGYQGHLIMTDEWFDEYMFRLVLETKYVPAKVMDIFKQKPIRLPAWDPMFAEEY